MCPQLLMRNTESPAWKVSIVIGHVSETGLLDESIVGSYSECVVSASISSLVMPPEEAGDSKMDVKMDDPEASRNDDKIEVASTVNTELRRLVVTLVSVVSNKYIMRRILLLYS
jgi:hypothetical protein